MKLIAFCVLILSAKTARLIEDDLGVLLLIIEVFLKNMHNLIVYEGKTKKELQDK